MEKACVTRREFKPISVINQDDVIVDFYGITFCAEEKMVEVGFWIKNEAVESLTIFATDVLINGESVKEISVCGVLFDDYFLLGEYDVGKSDYIQMEITPDAIADICSYEEIEYISFKIEIGDTGDSMLYCSKEIEILCDVKNKTFKISD